MNNLHLSGQDVLGDILEELFDGASMMLCCVGPTSVKLRGKDEGRSVCRGSQASGGRSGLILEPRTALNILIEAKRIVNPQGKEVKANSFPSQGSKTEQEASVARLPERIPARLKRMSKVEEG